MRYSEIAVMFLVFGGLFTFFLVPSKIELSKENHQRSQMTFTTALRDSLIKTIFHKKALFAFAFLLFVLIGIWESYAQLEWHRTAHGGMTSPDRSIEAIYWMLVVLGYSFVIYLLLAFRRAYIIVKNAL